jgi:thiamine pyrophosphokinase
VVLKIINDENIYKLNFKELKFDGIICLKGDLPSSDVFRQFGKLPLFAADGAANKLSEIGLIPDYIIGDLDSIEIKSIEHFGGKSKIIQLPDQDSSDFEKILNFIIKEHLRNMLILGFHGGDLEHTLNNWSILKKFAGRLNLCIYDKGRYGLPILHSIKFFPNPGELLSLIPQPKARLTTKNFKWELNDEILELGTREGARNQASHNEVSIILHDGELILFMDSRIPFAPELTF